MKLDAAGRQSATPRLKKGSRRGTGVVETLRTNTEKSAKPRTQLDRLAKLTLPDGDDAPAKTLESDDRPAVTLNVFGELG
jgi:hypothetical protein